MAKSPDAFRTISEVADWLGIQAHVLRFWESKFTQVKPIKRAGGRRYYRPADMLLLGGIKKLLHDDGLTIKGVQKILREEGMTHVADMSGPLDELTMSQLDDAPAAPVAKPATAVAEPEEEKGVVLNFGANHAAKPEADAVETAKAEAPETAETPAETAEGTQTEAPAQEQKAEPADLSPKVEDQAAPEPEAPSSKAAEVEPTPAPPATPASVNEAPEATPETAAPAETADKAEDAAEQPAPTAALPAFLRRPLVEPDDAPAAAPPEDNAPAEPEPASEPETVEAPVPPEPEPEPEPPAPKPRVIDMPVITPEADIPAKPAALTAAFKARNIKPGDADETRALLKQLTALRDSMAARRRNAAQTAPKD